MTILVLDDDPEERFAFRELLEVLYPQIETVFADNLLAFHECLFERGDQSTPYSKIFIDAQLNIPNDLDDEEYKAFLKEVGINDDDIESNDLMGWKYFDQVIRKKMPNYIQKVMIKTGFEKSIINSSNQDQLKDINILNKGDPEYQKKIKAFFNYL